MVHSEGVWASVIRLKESYECAVNTVRGKFKRKSVCHRMKKLVCTGRNLRGTSDSGGSQVISGTLPWSAAFEKLLIRLGGRGYF